MVKIVQKEDNVLRQIAKEVAVEDIQTNAIKETIKNMEVALAEQHDGVALAAPQIGESVRIFIVSEKVFEDEDAIRVFINPEITKTSKELENMHEGCLSVRGWYGSVDRHMKATVHALDENGKEFTLGASGLLAQIFQHEIDHLDGVLFTDKATDLQEVTEDNG